MNEDKFNMSLRRFLKEVGVTSQHQIEKAVETALSSGRLQNNKQLKAYMTLEVRDVDLHHVVEGVIELE
jgi:hypothetical protein